MSKKSHPHDSYLSKSGWRVTNRDNANNRGERADSGQRYFEGHLRLQDTQEENSLTQKELVDKKTAEFEPNEGYFEGYVQRRDAHEETIFVERRALENRKASKYPVNQGGVRNRRPQSRGMHEEDSEGAVSLSAPARLRTSRISLSSTASTGTQVTSSSQTMQLEDTSSEGVWDFAVTDGMVSRTNTTAGTSDVEVGDAHTSTHSERPQEPVVARAVTNDDLADQIRAEMRSEILQGLQTLQNQAASAAVLTVADSSASPGVSNSVDIERSPSSGHDDRDETPFWKTKRSLVVLGILLLVSIIAALVGVMIGTGVGDGGDNSADLVDDSPSDSPVPLPTKAPAIVPTDQPVVTRGPTTNPTLQPIPSPLPFPSSPTSFPTLFSTPFPTASPMSPPPLPLTPPSPTSFPTSAPTTFPTASPTSPPEVDLMQTIFGIEDGDRFGTYVEFSRDGLTMAVGANRGNYVRVFRQSGNSWFQVGQTIRRRDTFGSRLDLNEDGTILVVGAWNNDDAGSDAGQALVFQFNGVNQWIQLGQDLNGNDPDDRFGWAVSMSDDGMTIAVSGRLGDRSNNRIDAGYVKMFVLSSGSWVQLGPDLEGDAKEDQFGRSVAMSSDGRTLAVGANHGAGEKGRVRVYAFEGGTWNQIGQTLDGEAFEDFQGTAVALSSGGAVLAVAADGDDTYGDSAGVVRVYVLIGGSWVQRGQNIFGEDSGDQFGAGHISLSSDGKTLAVGAQNNEVGRGEGYLFRFDSFSLRWVQIAEVSGDNPGDLFGDSVNVSGDGSLFAVGAPRGDYVRVFSVS